MQDQDLKRRKLFVKGLPNSCDKHKLLHAFKAFGRIDKAYILYDHNNGSSRGFGFVEFVTEEDLLRALELPIVIDGKTIKCSRVFLKQETKAGPESPSGSNTPNNKGSWHAEPESLGQQPSTTGKTEAKEAPKSCNTKCGKALDGSIAWTKKTRESSGSSSEDQEDYTDCFNYEDHHYQKYPNAVQFNSSNGWQSPHAPAYGFFNRGDGYSDGQVYDQSNYYAGGSQHSWKASSASPIGWPVQRLASNGVPAYSSKTLGVYAACKSVRQPMGVHSTQDAMWSPNGGPYDGSMNNKKFEQNSGFMTVPSKASTRSYYKMF